MLDVMDTNGSMKRCYLQDNASVQMAYNLQEGSRTEDTE